MSRGNRKAAIFLDDRDRRRFLQLIDLALERYVATCYGYCLMGNHYHLVVCTPCGNISAVMRHINGLFTQYMNWRHGWTGHVLEARFRSIVIGDDHYLRRALAYLALNPVEAGLVSNAADWPWSSYSTIIGRISPPRWLSTEWLPNLFPDVSIEASRERFKEFISQPTAEYIDDVVQGGSDARQAVRSVIGANLYRVTVPRSYRALGRPSLGMLFDGVRKRDRRRLILRAHTAHGYRMAEIARFLDLHPSTISKVVNRSGSYRDSER